MEVAANKVQCDSTSSGSGNPCSAGRGAPVRAGGSSAEMQRMEGELEATMKRIREAEAKMTSANSQLESNHTRQKEILQERNEAMDERRRLDGEIQTLNDQITNKRDAQMKLQGSLQYRREDSLLEAIKRLESQLATHNYKMTEEKKIVQEIDRLKRSKKSLRDYNELRAELEIVTNRQRTMRNQRDASFHKVSTLRVREDAIKRDNIETRQQVDLLKKDIDSLYDGKRKLLADIKQAAKSFLHLRELDNRNRPNKRPGHNPYKKAGGPFHYQQQQPSPGDCSSKGPNSAATSAPRKDRCEGKKSPNTGSPVSEAEQLCRTLAAYLHKLIGLPSPASTSLPTPGPEPTTTTQASPQAEIYDGQKLLYLHRRGDDETPDGARPAIGGARSKRKEKREKRKAQQKDKLLVHTADIVEQFFRLHILPPSTASDIGNTLDALNAKRQYLARPKPSPLSAPETAITIFDEIGDTTTTTPPTLDSTSSAATDTRDDDSTVEFATNVHSDQQDETAATEFEPPLSKSSDSTVVPNSVDSGAAAALDDHADQCNDDSVAAEAQPSSSNSADDLDVVPISIHGGATDAVNDHANKHNDALSTEVLPLKSSDDVVVPISVESGAASELGDRAQRHNDATLVEAQFSRSQSSTDPVVSISADCGAADELADNESNYTTCADAQPYLSESPDDYVAPISIDSGAVIDGADEPRADTNEPMVEDAVDSSFMATPTNNGFQSREPLPLSHCEKSRDDDSFEIAPSSGENERTYVPSTLSLSNGCFSETNGRPLTPKVLESETRHSMATKAPKMESFVCNGATSEASGSCNGLVDSLVADWSEPPTSHVPNGVKTPIADITQM